jgi:hypothetical protein
MAWESASRAASSFSSSRFDGQVKPAQVGGERDHLGAGRLGRGQRGRGGRRRNRSRSRLRSGSGEREFTRMNRLGTRLAICRGRLDHPGRRGRRHRRHHDPLRDRLRPKLRGDLLGLGLGAPRGSGGCAPSPGRSPPRRPSPARAGLPPAPVIVDAMRGSGPILPQRPPARGNASATLPRDRSPAPPSAITRTVAGLEAQSCTTPPCHAFVPVPCALRARARPSAGGLAPGRRELRRRGVRDRRTGGRGRGARPRSTAPRRAA